MALIGWTVAGIALAVYLLFPAEKNVVVYETDEDSMAESQKIYWLLKKKKYKVRYNVPVNWEDVFLFGRGTLKPRISVPERCASHSRELIAQFRSEQRKMERNITAEKKKSETFFLGESSER